MQLSWTKHLLTWSQPKHRLSHPKPKSYRPKHDPAQNWLKIGPIECFASITLNIISMKAHLLLTMSQKQWSCSLGSTTVLHKLYSDTLTLPHKWMNQNHETLTPIEIQLGKTSHLKEANALSKLSSLPCSSIKFQKEKKKVQNQEIRFTSCTRL